MESHSDIFLGINEGIKAINWPLKIYGGTQNSKDFFIYSINRFFEVSKFYNELVMSDFGPKYGTFG